MLAIQKLIKDKYLNIQAKLVFPLAGTILLLVVILSPLTNRIINGRIEQEADRRLAEIADSVGALIENSEILARNNAALLADQAEVTGIFLNNSSGNLLLQTKEDLRLQELSLYSANFKSGDQAFFYGGPSVTRRLQVSEDALRIREALILSALVDKTAVSGVAISAQGSQIIGAAPVYSPQTNELMGVVLTAFYMDEAYIENISSIINTDIAIVKDNSIVVSTIDKATEYERLINEGFLDSAEQPAQNVNYSDGKEYRLLGHPLTISGNQQGSVLVTQPVDQLFGLKQNIQWILFAVTGVFALTALWFWIAAFVTFTRPLVQLTDATSGISQGDFDQRVNPSYFLFKDEITVLSENFNKMTGELNELYTSLEQRVEQRTQELAEARDDAVLANKSKSEFVSVVSHELKLPMTSIKGYSDLMLAGATGPLNENQITFLTTVRNNVNRMATLVSDLTDISRIESGNIRIEPRSVPVWDVVDEVVNLTRTQIDQKNQTVSLDIPEGLPKIWCDRNRFSQILTNLVSNANKYTPEGGVVHVQAMQANGMIQMKVQDNGLGMAPEDQEKLFSKFFRSADDKVREAPGTGLGLSITKNLIELQGGKIWFESEFRKGTTFYFTMPISQNTSPLQPIKET
ncbi:MAG: HAMP domain-containing protein [Anaerolineales bacterium]|nr:HAMP domain-containing protein [Anaerolineales bacterium]